MVVDAVADVVSVAVVAADVARAAAEVVDVPVEASMSLNENTPDRC